MKKLGLAGLAGILVVLLGLMLGGGPTVMGLFERAAQVVGPDIAQAAAQGAWLPIQNNPCNKQMRLDFYDEDTMVSDDACGVASQESVIAYIHAINGLMADKDWIVYGNAATAVLFMDAGNQRLGINDITPSVALDVTGSGAITGDFDVAGTCNADTLDVDGAAAFALTVGVTGKLTGTDADFTGTTDADTLDVDGDADFAATLNADTLDVDGAADFASTVAMTGPVTIATYKVPYTLKVDTTHVIQSGTTVLDAATLAYTLADTAGGVIEVLCGGTASGTTDAATLTVTAGSTVICTLANDAADTGHWQFNATIAVVAGGTVKTTCVLNQATQADVDAGYATTAIDLSAVTAWAVTLDLAGTTDDISKEMCIWKKAN